MNRVAVVTGGAGAIGGAIVTALGKSCHTVEVLDRAGDHPVDLANADDIKAAAARVLDAHGRCDVLVHAAAAFDRTPLAGLDLETWRRVQAVNVESALWLSQAFAPGMAERGFGRIVFVVSDTVWEPPAPDLLAYIASKAALIGVGRTLARALGRDGITVTRASGPFVAINCSAIPETLMESEIFGHERGAFTGAAERRIGCFELADGGTLLLDEIGEMPAPTQAKLLRVLEDRKVRRLGSKSETPVDVRVLAATNKDPEQAVGNGQLRQDLFFRLNVFHIHLPPLRDHKDDISLLVEYILRDVNAKHGKHVRGIGTEVMDIFMSHTWPGNVRELRNVLERSTIMCEKDLITRSCLPDEFGKSQAKGPSDLSTIKFPVGTTVDAMERELILQTLNATGNNKTRAADLLGISLKTLHNKLKEYGGSNADAE